MFPLTKEFHHEKLEAGFIVNWENGVENCKSLNIYNTVPILLHAMFCLRQRLKAGSASCTAPLTPLR